MNIPLVEKEDMKRRYKNSIPTSVVNIGPVLKKYGDKISIEENLVEGIPIIEDVYDVNPGDMIEIHVNNPNWRIFVTRDQPSTSAEACRDTDDTGKYSLIDLNPLCWPFLPKFDGTNYIPRLPGEYIYGNRYEEVKVSNWGTTTCADPECGKDVSVAPSYREYNVEVPKINGAICQTCMARHTKMYGRDNRSSYIPIKVINYYDKDFVLSCKLKIINRNRMRISGIADLLRLYRLNTNDIIVLYFNLKKIDEIVIQIIKYESLKDIRMTKVLPDFKTEYRRTEENMEKEKKEVDVSHVIDDINKIGNKWIELIGGIDKEIIRLKEIEQKEKEIEQQKKDIEQQKKDIEKNEQELKKEKEKSNKNLENYNKDKENIENYFAGLPDPTNVIKEK